MKLIKRVFTCITIITLLASVMAMPVFASRVGSTSMISRPSTVTRPQVQRETTAPTEAPSVRPIRPLPGTIVLKPTETTEPPASSGGTTIRPSRPLPGEENLIPTTAPSLGNDLPSKRPIPGEENLIPTTPTSPTPNGVIQKPIPSGTSSTGTSAVKPTEPAQKPAASITKSPYFTKHPTDESVKQGANAQFVAIAENANAYNWILLSADGRETYTIKEACSHFKGLKAEGSITTRLTLYYIPASLHGYYVACIAEGNGETVTSNGALISIQGVTAAATVQETQAVTVPSTEASTEPVTEAAEETAATAESTVIETKETAETTIPAATEEAQNKKVPNGIYLMGGICAVLLVVAIALMIILLKTLRKGKHH